MAGCKGAINSRGQWYLECDIPLDKLHCPSGYSGEVETRNVSGPNACMQIYDAHTGRLRTHQITDHEMYHMARRLKNHPHANCESKFHSIRDLYDWAADQGVNLRHRGSGECRTGGVHYGY